MMTRVHDWLRSRVDEMCDDLRSLVEHESPSDSPDVLRACADFLAGRARELIRADVSIVEDPRGPHLDIRVHGEGGPPVLLLGHFDTVWPVGTLAARPYEQRDGIASGPGVFDMKAGIVQSLWTVHALKALGAPAPPIRLFFNSDEEVQSTRSRGRILDAARHSRAVLVLEPSQDGAVKTARKGAGRFEIIVHGRAAHAGIDPQTGRSAISELARVIRSLDELADEAAGTTVNVGCIEGGTRANIVADRASALVDVRVKTKSEAERVLSSIGALHPSRDGLEIDARGSFGRPPMERTPQIATLYEIARRIGSDLGIDLREVSTGGASDANLCAELGLPILDGLGAVGAGAHAMTEHVLIDAIPARAALLAGLLSAL